MTLHRSLVSRSGTKRHRSVLKRYERIEILKKQEKYDEEKDSPFGLPKVKSLKVRIKKEKVAKEAVVGEGAAPAEAGKEGAAKPAEGAAKPAAGKAAGAKPAAEKK